MRCILTVSLVAISACASTNAPSRPSTPETVRIAGAAGMMQINTVGTTSFAVAKIAYPVDRVWRVLPMVYDSLPIPTNTVDNQSHLIGNSNLKTRRQLGKVPLSRFINCGNTQGGPSADTYEIILSVLTQVEADKAGGSTLTTTLEAQGRPITLASEYTRCSSTTRLETMIVDAVKARLSAAP